EKQQAHAQDGQQHQRDKCLILFALHLEGLPHLTAGFLALSALCHALFLLCSLQRCFILTLCHSSYFRVVDGGNQTSAATNHPFYKQAANTADLLLLLSGC